MSELVVTHSGWSAIGWSDDDPTAEEALAAFAGLRSVDYPQAMASLRRSGIERLAELAKLADSSGTKCVNDE